MAIDLKRVKEIFLEATELADETSRAAYLDRACGGDAGLRQRVEALLRSHDPEGSFLGTPAAVAGAPDLDETMALDSSVEAQAGPPALAGRAGTGAHAGVLGGSPSPDSAESVELPFLTPSTHPDALGRLGHYEILQILGRGGFGIVFRAFDEALQRVVAIKVLAPEMAAASPPRKRFLREARSSAKVRHENVVQVYSVEEEPLPYLVMEFVPGETLQQKLDRLGPLDVPETLRIGRQVAEGLAAAHATDLIHRDIKPGNVLLEGGHQKVKITDFGLARAADDASISQSGLIAGTPMYMAPEQAEGHTLDQRADLFSLGSVLYQMVSGRPPFRANTTVAVLKRVAEDRPRAIREIIPETPQWLCDIIAKLHAKNPDDRYQSAREVADVLADCEAQMKAHAKLKDYSRIPRTKPQPSGPRPRSRSRRWAAAAAVLLLLLGGLGITEATGVTDVRGTVIRLFSPEGTLVVEVDDPGVSIKIDESDIVITGAGAKEIRLKPGRYTVEARKDGKLVSRELVTVTKNGKQVVRVSHEAAPLSKAQRWEKSVAALPAAEQVEAVARRLKELNPGFNGTLTPTIEDGVVTGLSFVSDHVADISPVRALAGLKRLECPGSNFPNSKSKISDLSPLRGMKLTRLNCNMTMIADLSDLRGMPLGEELRLSETRVVDLSPLQGMPLKRLEINQTPVADLTPLKGMLLKALYMRETQAADLSPLRGMPLEALDFGGTHVTDLKPLKGMPLTRLIIYRTEVADLAPLRGMALELLEMSGTAVTDLSPLKGMPLKHLHIFESFRAKRDAAILRSLTTLQTIDDKPAAEFWERYDKGEFGKAADNTDPDRRAAEYVLSIGGGVRVDGNDRGIRAKSDLPTGTFRLTYVALYENKQVTDAGLAVFKDCKNLRFLCLYGCGQITDAGLAHFNDCKNLTRLELEGVRVTDAALAVFAGRKDLTELYLGNTLVTDAGLVYLKECKKLKEMQFLNTPATDAGLAHLKDCKDVTHLDLRGTKVTDAGLAYFKDCKNLSALWLDSTPITDTGLAHFKDCKNLKELDVRATKVSAAGIEPLAKALPQCKIVWNGGVIEPTVSLDPDRRAAEYVLSVGGTVRVDGEERGIGAKGELPTGAFRLTGVGLGQNKRVTDSGLAAFKGC